MAVLDILVRFQNQASGEVKDLTGDLRQMDQAADESGAAMEGTSTKSRALGVASGVALAGVAALGAGLAYSVAQAAEAEETQAQLNAVIESTGGAAGLTAEEVSAMAGALQQTTKFGDDAIIQGQNLLLTFTNIGEDVFPRATETMLDMATALGTDAAGGAVQLGKALNDPIAGVSALSRVGVTFTAEQKEMIAGMVEMGDVAGAQTVILDELAKEFGGSASAAADTFTGRMAQVNNQVGEVGEAVGGALLPVLTTLAETVLPAVSAAAEAAGEALEGMEGSTAALSGTNAEVVDEIIAGNIEHADSIEELMVEYEKISDQLGMYGGAAAHLTGTYDALIAGHEDATVAIAQESETLDEFLATMQELEPLIGTTKEARDAELATLYANTQAMTIALELQAEEERLRAGQVAAIEATTQARIAATAADMASQAMFPGYIALIDQYNATTGTYVTQVNGAESAAAAWVAEKTALADAAVIAQAALDAETVAIGNYFNATLTATGQADSFEVQLYEAGAAAGLGATELGILATATGDYTDAEIKAAFETAVMQANIDALVGAMQAGTITAGEAVTALDLLQTGEAETAADAIILAGNLAQVHGPLINIRDTAIGAADAIKDIPKEVNVHYTSTGSTKEGDGGGGKSSSSRGSYALGGFTGYGPSNQIAGNVHRNEFVLNEAATSRLGLPMLESLNQGGGMVGGADNSRKQDVTMINPQFFGVQSPQDLLAQLEAMTTV